MTHTALIFYDYFLLLDREVAFIWTRTFLCLSLLFFVVRYPTLIAVVGDLFVLNQWRGESTLVRSSLPSMPDDRRV